MTDISTARPPMRAAARATDVPSPPAARLARPRWTDLRLVVGVLLVLGSVLAGARIVAAADDTVPVLVATEDLAPGRPLTPSLVQSRQVALPDGAGLYLSGEVGQGWVVRTPVRAGELLPRSALVPEGSVSGTLRYVTVALPGAELPGGLSAGDRVDVWVVPAGQAPAQAPDLPPDLAPERLATRLLGEVTVTMVEGGGGGLGVSGTQRPVTLAVDGGGADLEVAVARLVAAARDGLVYLTAVPAA